MRARSVIVVVMLAASLTGCGGGGGGGSAGSTGAAVGATGGGGPAFGPTIPTGRPAVVLGDGTGGARLSPFPDDRMAVIDATSPTLHRLRVPLRTDTTLFRSVAEEINHLDGFGIEAPICVTFDDDLDPATIADATVLVVNAQPGSARFGQRVALDLGRGSYPSDCARSNSFYARDPLASTGSLVVPPGGLEHYEAASRTLILRPLAPLEEGARHVVVLMAGLRGTNGLPVSPPAPFPRPLADDAALAPALASAGASTADIRYQWAFTTGTPTLELRSLADGLDGVGPFAAALAAFPPQVERIERVDLGGKTVWTINAADLGPILKIVQDLARYAAPAVPAANELVQAIDLVDLTAVSHLAFGSIVGPDLRTTGRNTFDVDVLTGRAPVKQGRTTFMIVVPKPCPENNFARPPYDVIIEGHGEARSRIDGLGIASMACRHGYAVASFDAASHGPEDAISHLPRLVSDAIQTRAQNVAARAVIGGLGFVLGAPSNPNDSIEAQLKTVLWQGRLKCLFHDGRATDADGDGYTDDGALYFTADVFQTRDIIRQTMIDIMCLRKVIAGFGVDRNGNGKLDPEEGDLDGDGVADLGGPGRTFVYSGISLGGIVGSVLMGVDPVIRRAALMVPGAGFIDIVTTSTLRRVTGRVMHEIFSEVLLGDPDGAGGAHVRVDGSGGALGRVPTVPSGTAIARNGRTGVTATATIAADGGFRVHVPADQGDPLSLETRDLAGVTLGAVSLAAPIPGLGYERCTPAFREYLGLMALGIEASDPASYAPTWRAPAPGHPVKDVLLQISIGDDTVPTFTGASLGRAAGLISPARNDLLIRSGIFAGGAAANPDRTSGVESVSGAGIRFLGLNFHAGILFPNPSHIADGARYAKAAQTQALEFIDTGVIDDAFPIFDTILPP